MLVLGFHFFRVYDFSLMQVDKHIRRLDADLARFEADLKDKLEGSEFENLGMKTLKSMFVVIFSSELIYFLLIGNSPSPPLPCFSFPTKPFQSISWKMSAIGSICMPTERTKEEIRGCIHCVGLRQVAITIAYNFHNFSLEPEWKLCY